MDRARQESQENEGGPVLLRGHTLLCLQGFRGKGYSPGFVENLADIHLGLLMHPERWVEVIEAPDAVCAACPHRALSGCTLDGDDSEERMRDQDRRVLALLGLQAGTRLRWNQILDRIRSAISGDDLPGICGGCRWLSLGYCRGGIDRLRAGGDLSAEPIRVQPLPHKTVAGPSR